MPEWAILVAATAEPRWHFGIGDPDPLSWTIFFAYFVAAAGCFRAAWRDNPNQPANRPEASSRPSNFWLLLAATMTALGINKQLDFQVLVRQVGRDIVRSQGLASARHELNRDFIIFVMIACSVCFVIGIWLARERLRNRWPALVGMMFLFGFIMTRAAYFHHVNGYMMTRLGRTRWHWVFELGGIVWVGIAAFGIRGGRRSKRT
jgi:hypothetical protein